MKKIIFILITAVFLLPAPLFSAERVFDNADLLTADQKARLERSIEELASKYKFELMILTVSSIGNADSIDYSWDFLDRMGLYGRTWDGCILLQSVRGRDYAFTASGRGDKILNGTAYNKLEDDVLVYLKQDDYYRAYETYISVWEQFLILESKGRSYNFFEHYNFYILIGTWVVSLLIAFLIVGVWAKKMNTALPKHEADAYVVNGSIIYTKQNDRYLYSTVIKTKNASSSSGGSSRSGGGRSSRSGKY